MRHFAPPSNYDSANAKLKTVVGAAVQALFPMQSADGRSEVRATNLVVEAGEFDPAGRIAHQEARETGKTLGAKIYADLQLVRDGKVVDTKAKARLGDLPLYTGLGTMMVKGADWYTPFAQTRLKPGCYTREMANGQYEAFIPLKGGGLTVWMEPSKGLLKMGKGTTNVAWYAIMRALGVSEGEMATALGGTQHAKDIVDMNKMTDAAMAKDVEKFYEAVSKTKVDQDLLKGGIIERPVTSAMSYNDKVAAIKLWMDGKEVDPFVTRKTLGTPISKVGPELLLKAAGQIFAVQRGDVEPDDRDAPEFKSAHGLEDLLAERVAKYWRMTKGKTLRRLGDKDATLAGIFGNGTWINGATIGYFGGGGGMPGGLASTAEAANPLAILSEQSKMTLTGEGGIQSSHAITMGARLFRPTASNIIDLVHTPEGSEIGVTTHAAANVIREDKTLKAPYYPVTNGKVNLSAPKYLSIEQASDEVVMYPEYFDLKTGDLISYTKAQAAKDDAADRAAGVDPKDRNQSRVGLVRAIKDGEVVSVPAKSVTYAIPSGASMFDHTSNAALFFAHTHPNRGMMAGKHLTQALPLTHRELPLVGLKDIAGGDVLESIAKSFVVRATVDGKVTKVEKNAIWVGDVKHELFDKYPMQAKVAIHHEAVVKVGDTVKKGDLLADSNYSKDGKLALGTNMLSAYMPWKNASNFEDAIAISESAAQRLASQHVHRSYLDMAGLEVNRKLFIAQFPTVFQPGSLDKLDENGYIKAGSTVSPGDLLVLAVRKRVYDPTDKSSKNLGEIHKILERPYVNAALTWDEEFQGKVVRVLKNKDRVEVHLETEEPCRVGDKLSMSSAAKGTISAIIPDHEMPTDEKGRSIQVIFNPHGVAGRINPSQTIEQAAGKLVKDGGVTYDHANFDGRDHAREIAAALKKAGLKHAEILHDPVTGKDLEEPVATGFNYVVKLDHAVRKKFSARTRDGYTMDEEPTRGKGKGGQSFDHLTTYALLGHNAHAILSESAGIRGTKNDEFWHAYQAGELPPPPKVPFAFEKFRSYLHGMGIDTHKDGTSLHYLPMTDKKVREMSNGAVTRASLIRAKDLAAEKGGLFDEDVTGGLKGEHYSHIELGRSMPNPLFEKAIRDITGLKTAQFYGLIGETRHLDPKTGEIQEIATGKTLTGEAAFKHLLSFDIDKRLAEAKEKAKTAVGSDRNKLNRVTRYLRGLKTMEMSPADAYLTSVVPVVPPKYRPIIEMKDGGLRVADANLLYRDLLLTKGLVERAERDNSLPATDLAQARLSLYDAHAGIIGLAPAMTKRRDAEELRGFADIIKGVSNKEGLFQRNLTRRRNDYTGRSTIEPDATLGPDEIGIPILMAWKIYEPAIIRRLVQSGWKPADAMAEVQKKTQSAQNALDAEIQDRLVMINRAPSLHRWSVSSAKVRLVPGKEIKTSPLLLGPINGDYDGDTTSITVPLTDAAKKEAYNLLPSNNLFYDKDRTLAYGVDKDVITGLFMLTRTGQASGKKFADAEAAIKAFHDPKQSLKMNSIVQVDGKPQQIGWLILEALLPPRYYAGLAGGPIDGKKLEKLLTQIAEKDPASYNLLSKRIAQAGFTASAQSGGITATVDELVMDRGKINRLLDQLERDIAAQSTLKGKRDVALKNFEADVKPGLRAAIADHLHGIGLGGSIFLSSKPSSKLGFDSYQQMMASPVLVADVAGKVIPQVIKSGYGSGMAPSDYVLTTPGARAGIVARSLATALPGYLAKSVAGNMGPIRVTEADCGTHEGIEVQTDMPGVKGHDADLLDRFLVDGIPTTSFKRNDRVTPEMLATLRDRKVLHFKVRSAMTCKSMSPPCSMCAGTRPDGKLHEVGANIGLDYGQTFSERSTQAIMKQFHSGGTVGSGDSMSAGFARLNELLTAPHDLKDQGTLADHDGKVTEIRPAPQGGYYVTVTPDKLGETEPAHYIGTGRALKVKVGDHVKIGDALSDGSYRPQEIAAKKGNLAAQQYVVDETRKAYATSGAVVRRPVLEVVASATLRWVEITDDGGEHDLAAGDLLHENDYLARKAKNPRVQAVPTVPGLYGLPLRRSNDLMERLNFQRLTDTLQQVPAMGGRSDLTGGGSPVPGLAYGALFRPIAEGDTAFNRGATHEH
jgi:DNA-directed RNA polymerase subunit beta'